MRVLVDGHNLELGIGTGISTYTRSLTQVLKELGHEVDLLFSKRVSPKASPLMQEVQFFDLARPYRLRRVRDLSRGGRLALTPGATHPSRVAMNGAVVADPRTEGLPRHDRVWNSPRVFNAAKEWQRVTGRFTTLSNRELRADVAHWTFPVPVRLDGAANIYCIHDVIPLRLPATSSAHKGMFLRMLQTIGREADLIVTVSEAARRDILDILDIDEDRVVNTYQCLPDPEPGMAGGDAELEDQLDGVYGLQRGRYVLTYGGYEPRKNFDRLIEAHLASGMDIPLIRTGPGDLEGAAGRLLKSAGTLKNGKPRVRQLGYVGAGQLVDLIRGAACVAYPSQYEGFGLPIVEGFRCGTPVLTSNSNSMVEVAGDAAHLVDPYSVSEIRDGLVKICGDANYAAELVRRGHERFKLYTPAAAAERLDAAYAKLGIPGASRREP